MVDAALCDSRLQHTTPSHSGANQVTERSGPSTWIQSSWDLYLFLYLLVRMLHEQNVAPTR